MLKINNLHVDAENKEILKGVNLTVKNNEIHVIMGPNGTGKSTLCKTIMKDPDYKITKGKIEYNKIDITDKKTDEIAKLGIFLLMQNPTEIPGVSNIEMLRTALKERGVNESVFAFNKRMNEICDKLNIDKSFLTRGVNERMSGGEKKKNELIGIYALKPSLILLDELDSGLDIDSLKTLSEGLLKYKEESKCSIIIITHHMNILNYLKPDRVHILNNGVFEAEGDINLAESIEENGFNGTLELTGDAKNE